MHLKHLSDFSRPPHTSTSSPSASTGGSTRSTPSAHCSASRATPLLQPMPSFTRESGGTLHVAVMGVNRIGKDRGSERPPFPRRLLQAKGRPRPQARGDPRQAGGRSGHPREARCRDRRPPLQRAAGHRLDQRRYRVLQGLQAASGPMPSRRPRVRPPQGRCGLLAACGGQQGCPANPGGPSPGEGGQPARPRGQEDRAQGYHRRLQSAVWREPRHQQLRPLLPGRPAAHQGSAVPQSRPAR